MTITIGYAILGCLYLFLMIFSGIMNGVLLHKNNKIETGQRSMGKGWRFPPYSNTGVHVEIYAFGYLATLVLTISLFILLKMDVLTAIAFLFRLIMPLGTAILFFCILLPFSSSIRKHFTARTSASLWQIPFYILYLTILVKPEIHNNIPLFAVIHLSNHSIESVIKWIALIWFVGIIGVFSWHIITHFAFRHRLLKAAYPITDGTVLDIWNQEERYTKFTSLEYLPLICPLIHTPMTIGLFNSSIQVLLPEKAYTPEELSLVFRHELVHISRNDDGNKFSMILLCSLFWFNPLMWIARQKASEDLELSCDESVLLDADEQKRIEYANLLLQTAGDERGFTTCLSASLESMRYRLNSITRPKKRHIGGALVATVTIALYLTAFFIAPNIAFTHNSTTLGSAIQMKANDSVYIESIWKNQKTELFKDTTADVEFEINNQAALCKQIMELNVAELLSMRDPPLEFEEHYMIHLRVNGDFVIISINENYVQTQTPHGDGYVTRYYKLTDALSIEQSLIPAS